MHSVAARIALLAYLVGGMAVPILHRHESGTSHRGITAHAHAECLHAGHSHPHPPAASEGDAEHGEDSLLSTAIIADAPSEQPAACSDNCVVCSFAGSAQSAAPEGAVAFSANPGVRLNQGHVGPGFEASAYEQNRRRGPPVSLILG